MKMVYFYFFALCSCCCHHCDVSTCTLGYVVPEVGAYLWHWIVPLIELSTSCSEAGALTTDLCQALIYLFLQ